MCPSRWPRRAPRSSSATQRTTRPSRSPPVPPPSRRRFGRRLTTVCLTAIGQFGRGFAVCLARAGCPALLLPSDPSRFRLIRVAIRRTDRRIPQVAARPFAVCAAAGQGRRCLPRRAARRGRRPSCRHRRRRAARAVRRSAGEWTRIKRGRAGLGPGPAGRPQRGPAARGLYANFAQSPGLNDLNPSLSEPLEAESQ